MDAAFAAIIIGAATLLFHVVVRVFGGGWGAGNVSSRLEAIETTLTALQVDFRKLSEVLVIMANLKGDIDGLGIRITRAEHDIREIRHGEGFVLPLMRPKPSGGP